MKNWPQIFKKKYLDASAVFFPSLFILALISLWYRLEIYRLVKLTYVNLDLLTFPEYLEMSLYYDVATLIYLLAVLVVILIPFSGLKRFRYITAYIFLMVVFGMLLSGIEFFRVYETTFRPGFIGKENSDYWLSMTNAYFAEATVSYYVRFLIAGILIVPSLLLLFYKRSKRPDCMVPNRFYLPATMLLLAVLLFAVNTESIYASISKKFSDVPDKKIGRTLNDISMNPLFNIFIESREKKEEPVANIIKPGDRPFMFGFDSDSVSGKKYYPRINHIPRGKRYNIILYFFESTSSRYIDLKHKGRDVAGTWKELMKNSLVMKNHYANFPLSANAMFSVFTSSYDPVFKGPFDDNLVTMSSPHIKIKSLPEILKDQGYRTSLLHTWILKYVGQKKFLKTRKFDKIFELDDLKKISPGFRKVGLGLDERAMIDPAVKFMKEDPDKPFFVTFVPMNPHSPYNIPDNKKFLLTGEIPTNTPYRKKRWLNYINSLYYSDYTLGLLMDRLEKENLLENTLVFIFADHGQAFYQHRQNYLHRHFIYEENVHVPFIIYNKKLFSRRIDYDGVTSHIDILPTILDALSIKQNSEHEGMSILSSHVGHLALLHTYWDEDFNGVRDGKWKYILRMKDRYEELFDLEKDPMEKKNLAGINKDMAEKYREVVDRSQSYKEGYYKKVLQYR